MAMALLTRMAKENIALIRGDAVNSLRRMPLSLWTAFSGFADELN